jgi:hypothetical protein
VLNLSLTILCYASQRTAENRQYKKLGWYRRMVGSSITAVGGNRNIVAENWTKSFDFAIANLVDRGFDHDHAKLTTFGQVFGQGATIPGQGNAHQSEPTARAFGVQNSGQGWNLA